MTETAKVIAMCVECRRGYVMVNWKNARPSCIACGGLITAIDPIPNEWPHVRGAFVEPKQEPA